MKETTGDHYDINCPYCNGINHYVDCGIVVELHKIKEFEKPCSYCGKTVYYRASYEIRIKAYNQKPDV